MFSADQHDIILDSQLPQGISGEKLKDLEKGSGTAPLPEDAPGEPPKFITQIESVSTTEGEPVHFECRVEPKNDPHLNIEWYHNGKLLKAGHRFRTLFDLGYVSLTLINVYPEDAGEYVCRAYNKLGEDFTKATITCKSWFSHDTLKLDGCLRFFILIQILFFRNVIDHSSEPGTQRNEEE